MPYALIIALLFAQLTGSGGSTPTEEKVFTKQSFLSLKQASPASWSGAYLSREQSHVLPCKLREQRQSSNAILSTEGNYQCPYQYGYPLPVVRVLPRESLSRLLIFPNHFFW